MTTDNILNQNDAEVAQLSLLGKPTPYINQYDKSLLVPIPREWGRNAIGLTNSLPFIGLDVWNAYEVSFLNLKGKPITLMCTIAYAPTSPFLVESKSLKMYLNSLNLTRFKDTENVLRLIEDDLSTVLQTPVLVQALPLAADPSSILSNYSDFECLDGLEIEPNTYEVDPTLLAIDSTNGEIVHEKWVTHLFKSNCPCTHLPDFASVFIEYKGPKIRAESLLLYLISFREHQAFHEQCVEQIFTQIQKFCQTQELMVFARFTRRGGLDINPYRSSKMDSPIDAHINLRTLRQ